MSPLLSLRLCPWSLTMMETNGNVSRRIRHAPGLMCGASHSQSYLSHARKQCPTLFNDRVYFSGGATTSSLRSIKNPISLYTSLYYTRCDDSFQRSRKERSSLLLWFVLLLPLALCLLQTSVQLLLLLVLLSLLLLRLAQSLRPLLVWPLSLSVFTFFVAWSRYGVNGAHPFVLLNFYRLLLLLTLLSSSA